MAKCVSCGKEIGDMEISCGYCGAAQPGKGQDEKQPLIKPLTKEQIGKMIAFAIGAALVFVFYLLSGGK